MYHMALDFEVYHALLDIDMIRGLLLFQIFTRERLNGHYGVSSFVVANTLSSFPFLGLTAVFPGSIVYILGGLHPGADRLFYFIVTLLACLSGVEGLLMAIASLVPDFLLGMMIGSGLMVYLWRKQHNTLMFWILNQISLSFGNFHNTSLPLK